MQKEEKMVLGQHRRIVGLFSNRQDVEHALNELNSAGFPMNQIYVVAKEPDLDEQLDKAGMSDFVGNKAQEGATIGALIGSILGAIGGVFAEIGILAVPGFGHVVAAGIAGTALATAITGAGIGAASGGLIETLAGLGVPEDQAIIDVESERFSQCEYLVMVDGKEDELRRAESIFSKSCLTKMWVC